MIKLGDRVKDGITGFQGIAGGRCEYLYGCSQINIIPEELDKDSKRAGSEWFDEARLEVVQPGAVKGFQAQQTTLGPAGDEPLPTRSHAPSAG